MRALLAIAIVVATAARTDAAPWSFNLPAGYTEQPGAADEQLAQLRKVPGTVSADAQVYLSSDENVQLTRMTWVSRPAETPTKAYLLGVDRGMVTGSSEGAKHISDSSHFAGNHLIADQVDDIDGVRMIQRRIYAVDTANVVTMFLVMCAGQPDVLADCENAQQSMQLSLPNQATLRAAPPERSSAYKTGRIVGQLLGALILGLLVYKWYKSGAPIWRRPKKS
jgi:hypothetical protein